MLEKRINKQIQAVQDSFNVNGFIGPSKQNQFRSYDEFVRRITAGQENILKRFDQQRETNGDVLRKFTNAYEKITEVHLEVLEAKKEAGDNLEQKAFFIDEKIKLFKADLQNYCDKRI